ncbi:hypothetical protein OG417_51510 [Actinoallomurus sp. NBC_01490]|uniref:hypothetical protein n=1 Tax=Actinoallomurus sp. NBC_01490 TaxID=2903557 RepID=UPI002E370503|nr:hypothetical protein [Actinoallomurus sp. NBC_01490]
MPQKVARVHELLAPLIDEEMNDLHVWVANADAGDAVVQLHSRLTDRGLLGGDPEPLTVDRMAEAYLRSASADEVLPIMLHCCTRDLAWDHIRGPWTEDHARPVLSELVELLGPGARWLTNVTIYGNGAFGYESIAGHDLNNFVVLGAADDIVVGILRVAEIP